MPVPRLIQKPGGARAVFVRRNDRSLAPTGFPQPTGERVLRGARDAPRPPLDSRFYGFGRDAAHAPTPIKHYAGGLAIQEWLSVMAHPFGIAKVPSAMVVNTAHHGRQNPFSNRPNIKAPEQTNLGDQYALEGRSMVPAELWKIQ